MVEEVDQGQQLPPSTPLLREQEKVFEGVKRFSSEAREALEKEGYVVVKLTGQSIISITNLREERRPFWADLRHIYPDVAAKTSMISEVAVKPDKLFLQGSNRKTSVQQEAMVGEFSKEIGERIKGVKAILGEAPDYVELAFTHLDKTGDRLFGEKDNFDSTRTKTDRIKTDGFCVGNFFSGDGLHVDLWGRDAVNARLWAAPLVVPA